MPTLPETFQFSQNNLQDYQDCARRFQLRYLLKQKWPALQSQPAIEQERRMKQGQAFHQLVFRQLSGLPAESVQPSPDEVDLWRWWNHFLNYLPEDLPARRYPEFALTSHLAGYRILAKYDLIAVEPGQRLIIYDWKTSRRRTPRAVLQARIQTLLYMFLAVEAGFQVNDGLPVEPAQVEMVYWFTDYPDDPEHFQYSLELHEAGRQALYRLITRIASTQEKDFFPTVNQTACQFCTYRSLCGRGVTAGMDDEMEEDFSDGSDSAPTLNFDQIGDIQF